jgi:hypothetical protein
MRRPRPDLGCCVREKKVCLVSVRTQQFLFVNKYTLVPIYTRLDVQRHVSDLQIHLHAVGRFTNCGQVAVCYHLFHYRGVHTQYVFASLV